MWAAIIIVAAPVLLQQTMTACVGLVDKMLSGSLPDTIVVPAMDAIGIGSYLTWFLAIAMSGLGIEVGSEIESLGDEYSIGGKSMSITPEIASLILVRTL